jgi:hypothetical protein
MRKVGGTLYYMTRCHTPEDRNTITAVGTSVQKQLKAHHGACYLFSVASVDYLLIGIN